MGPRLGTVLYGLPPNLRKDVVLLREFLNQLPRDLRAAFEFRHASWFDDETFAALRDAGAALCINDMEELSAPFVRTAEHGYLRLRRAEYSQADLASWAERIRGAGFTGDVFVYLKHEDEAKGPRFAEQLIARLSGP